MSSSAPIAASLHALLSGVIDYAGMFPPAKLPLDQAVRNYARYRREPEGWMLGRFLCPATRLTEVGSFCSTLFADKPCIVSAVGRGGGTLEEFERGLQEDVPAIAAFTEKNAMVDAFETRLPLTAVSRDVVRAALVSLVTKHMAAVFHLRPCVEMGFSGDWRSLMRELLQKSSSACFKLRCGGLEVSAFPSPEQIAFVIAACRDAGVALKFTAGLHHPIRHFNTYAQTKMHGFINLFAAGALAHARKLTEQQIQPIIEDEDAGHFHFDDSGLTWKDLSATLEEIEAARTHVLSFGSCSFDEPRDDLRKLGWLP
jgi:hypothetical protein